jgi:RHS repeat-associated protein
MTIQSLITRGKLEFLAFLCAGTSLGFAQTSTGPDNPPVSDCNCPDYVSVTPDSPVEDGYIKLKRTKEGLIIINVVATPPQQGAIEPSFRVTEEGGKVVASASGWAHTFTLSTIGLRSPITLETIVDCPNYSSSGKKICDTKRFRFGCDAGDCGPGGTCQAGVGQPSGSVDPSTPDSFKFELPIGSSSQGDETTGIHFSKSPSSPISIGDFEVHSNGGFTHTGNEITTGTTVTTLSNGGGGVTVEIKKVGSTDVFRTYQFNSVTTGGSQTLTLVETRCGQPAITHVWSKTNQDLSYSTANGLRLTTATVESDQNFIRVERHKVYEKVAGVDVLVSDERLHYEKYHWGERLIRRDIDPDTANLTTNWTYGSPSDGLAYGRLKSVSRHDGYTETHTYGTGFHQVDSSGGHQRKFDFSGSVDLFESRLNGLIYEKRLVGRSGNSLVERHYSSGADQLETTTEYLATGSDFGGQPASASHPDGTLTTYAYARVAGNRVTTVSRGKAVGGVVTDGTATVTTVNQQGQTTESVTTDIVSGVKIGHTKALLLDGFGRPVTIGHFPDSQNIPVYTESRTYTCCKLTSETDIHGVITEHSYDLLGRQITTKRHGVVQETVYKGLTETSHRYPVGQVAGAANRIGETTRNLAGTIVESWAPDASSNVAGALVKTTKVTTFVPGAGLSKRVVITVPGNHSQTEDYRLDGRLKETYGDLSPHVEYAYTATATGLLTAQALKDGANYREITGTQNDWAGRIVASGRLATLTSTTLTATTSHAYELATGRLLSVTDPDGVVSRFGYNDKGEREITVLERNNNTTTDYGVDQVTRNVSFVTTRTVAPTIPVIRNEVHIWQDGAAANSPTLASYSERTPDGLFSWSWQIGGQVARTESTVGPNRTEKSISPDGSYTLTTYHSGLMDRAESYDSNNNLISSVAVRDQTDTPLSGYDNLKRSTHQKDSRTGITITSYLSSTADVASIITDPGNRITTFTYDSRGRRTHVDAPNTFDPTGIPGNSDLTNITITAYNPDGTTQSVTGAQNYPVSYTYDYAKRMKTMTTTGSSGNVITAWNYSTTTGQLLSKRYNSNLAGTTGAGPTYEYTAAGRLWKRFWARPVSTTNPTLVTTTYGYTHGRLTSVTYNDGTPNLVYTHDNLGRTLTVTRGGVSHYIYDYNPATLRLATEHQNLDTMARRLHRYYDSFGRPLSIDLTTTASTPVSQYTTGYSYDAAGRLQNVWHHPALDATTKAPTGSPTFTYGYTYAQANPGDLRAGATTGSNLKQDYMPYTVTRNAAGANPALTATRTYEATRDVLRTIENKAGATVVSSFTYTVNAIGQRESVATAGTAFAGVQADWAWKYDALGQVVAADHANTPAADRAYQFDSIGNRVKTASGTLTLPGTANWVSNALNQYTTANGVVQPTTPAPAPFDADGNMTAGPVPGSNGNTPGAQAPANATEIKWDAENRLISLKIGTATYGYVYDHLSRLTTRSANGTVSRRYHYDGWNRIAEFTSSALVDTFTWGLDLSGSMQGAGGVGGLLATRLIVGGPVDYFPTYDGNGNVSEYLGITGNNVVHYEYDPFGTLTRRTGSTSIQFQYRFSTKPRDFNTGLYYYGYRWYDPVTGRWPSRDPIEERGGVNLYGFVGNDGVNRWDLIGLVRSEITVFSGLASRVSIGTRGSHDRIINQWDPAHKIYAFLENESTETDSQGYTSFIGMPVGDIDVAIRTTSRWSGFTSDWQDVNSDTEPRPSPTMWKQWGVSVTSPSDPVLGEKGFNGRCVQCFPYIVGVNTITTHDKLGDLPDYISAVAIFAEEALEAPIAVMAALAGFANKNEFVTKQQIGVALIICADGKRHVSAYGYPTRRDSMTHGHNATRSIDGSWIHSSPGGNTGVLTEGIFAAWD